LTQNFESINSIAYAGKTVTLSFYARKGANYSPTSSLLNALVITGTGTDENVIYPGYTGNTQAINQNATLTTTWQRFQYTSTIATTATEMCIQFAANVTGTAGAADYFEITGVQLEVGSVATPFKTYAGTIQEELAACQRYYYRSTAGVSNKWILPMCVSGINGVNAIYAFSLPVTMRTTPSSVDSSTIQLVDGLSGYAITAITLSSDSSPAIAYGIMTVASGLTVRFPYSVNSTSASGYVGFSAEL